MTNYIARRLLLMIPTVFLVTLIIFSIFRMLPGDAALVRASEGGVGNLDPEQYEELRKELGLDRPAVVQYGDWIWGLMQLDGGDSLVSGQPVFKELQKSIPITIELAILALVISLLISVPLGVLTAIRQDGLWDYAGRLFTTIGLAAPSFLAGAMLILVLVVYFHWLPPLEYKSFLEDPRSNLGQMIWPALILGFHNSAILARMTRSSMLEVLRQDYMRTALAKGLHPRVSVRRHALRNALLPVVTIAGIEAGTLLGGSVIAETIFVLPGVGKQLISAIEDRDWVTVQTIVTLFAATFLVLNLVVDLVYAWLDPRIRYQS